MKLLMNNLPTTSDLLDQCYDRATNNMPELGVTTLGTDASFRAELKHWYEPCWEIYRFRGNHVLIAANRPNKKEIFEGDSNGRLGSYIRLAQVSRRSVHNALRIARMLCNTDARRKILIPRDWLIGISEINTDLKVYSL